MLRVATLVLVVLVGAARAEDACDTRCRIDGVRAMLGRGEIEAARKELLVLHADTQLPELLFALGQVELQLEHYEAAIGYYERFLATNPAEDQIALAQQAIGAARMRLTQPPPKLDPPPPVLPPPPPPRRYERRWDGVDTVLVVAGALALAGGGALLYNAHRIGNDTGGTLAEYDDRLEHARFRRFTGVGVASAGVITLGLGLLRWRLDRTEIRTEIQPAGGAMVHASRRW